MTQNTTTEINMKSVERALSRVEYAGRLCLLSSKGSDGAVDPIELKALNYGLTQMLNELFEVRVALGLEEALD